MKKRMFTLALAMTLALGCMAVPASAAASARSEEMTKVTLAVKQKLGIGDEYTGFSGDCTDLGVLRYWQLNWSGEDGRSLSVAADNTGRILSYDCYTPENEKPVSTWESGGFNPSFPEVTTAQVERAAKAFLAKVTASPESAKLDPVTLRLTGYRRSASVTGTILLNGVESPISFSMRLSLPGFNVTSYNRRDAWGLVVTGGVPSSSAAVTKGAAKDKLDSTLSLELRYVDTGDGKLALYYVPTTKGNWYVDAQTGALVDLTKLPGSDRPFFGTTNGAVMDKEEAGGSPSEAPMPSLSPVEQNTVDQMAGTLSAEELDALLKKIAPLGLDKMTQAGASYYMNKQQQVRPLSSDQEQSDEILCRLTYTRDLTQAETAAYYDAGSADTKPMLRKHITVDAKTGALKSVTSSTEYAREDAWTGDAASVAKSFLSAQFPEQFAACVRRSEDTDAGYYVRQVNGIPYYGDYLRASVCGVDGTIGSFSTDWDEDLVFPAAEGVVDEKAAMATYAGCYETALYYTPYPEKVDTSDPQWLTYSQHVGDVKYRWVLTYVRKGETPQGVDALTGELVTYDSDGAKPLTYTDCANAYGRAEIEALASYGVGFGRGTQFRPTAQVTQRDMLVLLLNAVGYAFDADSMDQEGEDSLYDAAVSQGLLDRSQRDPSHAVTRLEFLKTMLTPSAYGKAAQLQGIYKTTFSDAGSIPAADLGYAAIGQALGIVGGDTARRLNPSGAVTRQDAAIMLCRFMGM